MLEVTTNSVLSHGDVRDSLRKFSWKLLRRQLDKVDIKKHANELLGCIKRSDFFINKRPAGKARKVAQRAELFKSLLDYLSDKLVAEQLQDFISVFGFFDILDECYAEFLSFEGQLPAVKELSSGERAWAFFIWYQRDYQAFMERVKDTVTEKGAVLLDALVITLDNGVSVEPSAYHMQQVSTLTSALKMEAYREGWFDAADKIILPQRQDLSIDQVSKVGVIFINANSWSTFEDLEQQVRYLGRQYTVINGKKYIGAPAELKYSIKFGECVYPHVLDYVAMARNFRRDYGNRFQISAERQFKEFFRRYGEIPPVAVAKEHHLSAMSLSLMLNYDIEDDGELYHGLTLSDWIKGYSALKFFVRQRQSKSDHEQLEMAEVIEFQLSEFMDFLLSLGFGDKGAQLVIENLSFSKRTRDLFDAPIIHTANGCVAISDVVSGAVISRAVASNILTRGTVFKMKGSALEDRVNSIFSDHGIEVKKIKKRYADGEYEYDALAVWGRKLFILECKNRWLSEGRVIPIYNIWDQMREDISQVKRLQRGIERHPDIVTQAFNRHVDYDEIVPCIVAGVPYALERKVQGVYFTDISVIDRFFSGNEFTYEEIAPDDDDGSGISKVVYNQWRGDEPSVDDLIKVLDSPLQVRVALKSLNFEKVLMPVGTKIFYEAEIPTSKPLSAEQYVQLINDD